MSKSKHTIEKLGTQTAWVSTSVASSSCEMSEETKDKTVFRVAKNADNPFVMIDRRPIENPALSWKAKGILAYLLSRPDDWVIRFRDLVNRSTDGGHMVRAAMKELKAAGHLKVTTEREGGRIVRWVYQVYEIPLVENQEVEKQQVKKRASTNKKVVTKKNSKDIKAAPPQPPEIVLFRDVVRHYPKQFQRDTVIEAIQKVRARLGRELTTEDLHPFFSAWGKVSGNEWSLVWLTDWAVPGFIPNGKGNNNHADNPKPTQQYTPEQRALAERINANRAAGRGV
jgi:hypothetical protein